MSRRDRTGPRRGARRASCFLLAAGALSVLASAAPAYGQTAKGAAAAPDFTGVWGKANFAYPVPYVRGNSNDFTVVGGFDSPLLKPWTVQLLVEKSGYTKSGNILPVTRNACWPGGPPATFSNRHIQILQTPSQITILFRGNIHSRTIYFGEKHSDRVVPSWSGESIGHWEGGTLVVDTVGFAHRPEATLDNYGTPVTDGLHVVERYRYYDGPTDEPPTRVFAHDFPGRFVLDDKGKVVQIAYTVEDPHVFRKPWSGTLYFRPVVQPEFAEETICVANNRDWDRLIPVAPTPDF